MSWIQTHSGKRFDLLEPRADQVDIVDIAHSLANLCRFNGHVRQFYSVAQHSYFVSRIVGPEYALCGLLHDATEAYVGDMTRPLKSVMPRFKEVEDRIWLAIAERFGLPREIPPAVKHADNIALVTERRDLLKPSGMRWDEGLEAVPPRPDHIRALDPGPARHAFINRFAELGGARA
jgi:5'-deoxynucleotidase YfbR-like HD superfamily hydrolase